MTSFSISIQCQRERVSSMCVVHSKRGSINSKVETIFLGHINQTDTRVVFCHLEQFFGASLYLNLNQNM